MHIKTIRAALITNYEVLRLLEESQERQKQVQIADPSVEYPEHLRTVQFEVKKEIYSILSYINSFFFLSLSQS